MLGTALLNTPLGTYNLGNAVNIVAGVPVTRGLTPETYTYILGGANARFTPAAAHVRSDMYTIIQAERPSVVSQLMYVMNQSSQKNDIEIKKRVVALLREMQTLESENACRELVSCMSDSNLKEYLLPSI